MFSPITASVDTLVAQTFGSVNPQPVPEVEARVVSEKTNDFTGFFADQGRVTITSQAQHKANTEQQIHNSQNNNNSAKQAEAPSNESISVSSSVGRAASSGNLRREEAMAIYQKIAALI
jgi:hypothetical protein